MNFTPLLKQIGRTVKEEHASKKKIYLDQNYWNNLRDVARGTPKNAIFPEIYKALSRAVSSGRAICPLSAAALIELKKQSDPQSRTAFFKVVNELSLNAAITSGPILVVPEFLYFIEKHTPPRNWKDTHRDSLVWTRTQYLSGDFSRAETNPKAAAFLAQQQQKLSLETIAEQMFLLPQAAPSESDIPDEMNAHLDKMAQRPGFTSEARLELIDLLEDHDQTMVNAILHADEHQGVTTKLDELPNRVQALKANITKAINESALTDELGSLRVLAQFYAAIKASLDRPIKPTDLEDSLHASYAVPYFDIMLTERSLRHLLSTKPVDLLQSFPCKIEFKETEALALLGKEFPE